MYFLSNIVTQQLSAEPATPAAGFSVVYAKTDGKWYIKNSDAVVTEITNPDDDFLLVNSFRSLYQY